MKSHSSVLTYTAFDINAVTLLLTLEPRTEIISPALAIGRGALWVTKGYHFVCYGNATSPAASFLRSGFSLPLFCAAGEKMSENPFKYPKSFQELLDRAETAGGTFELSVRIATIEYIYNDFTSLLKRAMSDFRQSLNLTPAQAAAVLGVPVLDIALIEGDDKNFSYSNYIGWIQKYCDLFERTNGYVEPLKN